MSDFVARLSRPEAGNKYYIRVSSGGYSTAIKGKPTDKDCDVLHNCVGYAVGRFHEIANRPQFDLIDCVNAENIFSNAKMHGLKTGDTPKLGALIVWRKGDTLSGSDGAGHVAVVEKINPDGSIITSESGYNCNNAFWTTKRYKPYSNGSGYSLLGFVYQPERGEIMYKGINVSAHQNRIDWGKVKTDFAILRAGYGKLETQKDKQFENNYAGAKAAGIPVGAYWYSYAKTPEEARLEADICLKVLKDKQFEYPIFYDVEEQTILSLGKEKVSSIIRAFLEEVEKAGYWVGLYMSASPLKIYVSDTILQRYAIWVAQWSDKLTYSGSYGIWQYSEKGTVSGINGNVDLDYCNVDYPAKIKEKGLNGYGKPPEQPKESIYTEVSINGKIYKGTLTTE